MIRKRIGTLSPTEQLEQFIVRSEEKHGKKYDYSKTVYVNTQEKVIIICPDHGEFSQRACAHMQGKGCYKCRTPSCGSRKTQEAFILKAKEKHGDRYDYSKVKYVNSTSRITIICRDHGDFQQVAIEHLRYGCAKCAATNRGVTTRITQEEFVKRATSIHDGRYDYSKVIYTLSNKKVIIICPDHGEFMQIPNSHLLGNGCALCGYEQTGMISRLTRDEFIERSNMVHSNTYIYDKVVYNGVVEKVIIICRIHGEFKQTPASHIQRQGCPQCGHKSHADLRRSTTEEFITRARIMHGDTYLYDKVVYVRSTNKVIITCRIHGDFEQIADSHLFGYRCMQCARKKSSRVSLEWLRMLKCTHPNLISHEHPTGEYRIPMTRYLADGFCPDTNTIYEFHGDYWHGNPARYHPDTYNASSKCTMGELYQRTLQKRARCEELGYRYVEIWESQWLALKKFLRRRMRLK